MSLNDPAEQAKRLLNINQIYEATFNVACLQRAIYEAYIDAGFEPPIALRFTEKQIESMARRNNIFKKDKEKT